MLSSLFSAKATPVTREQIALAISKLSSLLAEWIVDPKNASRLSVVINKAIDVYEKERDDAVNRLGKPVAPPTTESPLQDAASTALYWGRSFFAATTHQALSNSAEQFREKSSQITSENAKTFFLSFDKLEIGGWAIAGHSLGLGRASLKTRIVATLIEAFLVSNAASDSCSDDEDTNVKQKSVSNLSEVCTLLTDKVIDPIYVKDQAEEIYLKLIGCIATQQLRPQSTQSH
ncbi:MAG: hypothetical protein NTZ67_04675 [Gammaproteobacteria bacterium]|nr:hypothetical protein [Gammaproteobacteria bacterium]